MDFKAIDDKPVHNFFLIVAPPMEVSNQYLPVLGKIAQFAKEPNVPERLEQLKSPEDFLTLPAQECTACHTVSADGHTLAIGGDMSCEVTISTTQDDTREQYL